MGSFHGYYNPKQDVDISCPDCSNREKQGHTTPFEEVRRSQGILGVPATYTMVAEKQHLRSPDHAINRMRSALEAGADEAPHAESAAGRIDNFVHGKDHINPWTGNTAEEEERGRPNA
jgi:hypothetical protein